MAHPQHITPALLPDGEIRPVVRAPGVERWSWALYDFANTIFSMNIATLYFSVWIVADLGSTDLVYAVANAAASVLMVVAIPVLGAISDARRKRKPWVVGFTLASCIGCVAIGVLGRRSSSSLYSCISDRFPRQPSLTMPMRHMQKPLARWL